MSIFGEAIGSYSDKKLYKEDSELVSNIDGIGVEIELENIHYYNHNPIYPNIYTFWKTVEDGSLREGTEFIFKEPMVGANISEALRVLSEFLSKYKKNGKGVQVSDRCSVHVHLDIRDLTNDELTNLILIYIFVERLLFHYINPTRAKNNYCRPLTDSSFKFIMGKISECNKYDHPNSRIINLVTAECDKYSALNILPIYNYGSVEFRHHHGTTDTSQIKKWINIILAIKNCARSVSIETLIKSYESSGFGEVLHEIFAGTSIDEEYLSGVQDLDIFMHKGYIDVKEILDLNKLMDITNSKKISKVRPENTLFHQFKKNNGFVKEPKTLKEV